MCREWDRNNALLEPINMQYWAVAFQLFVHGYLFAGSYCVCAQARRGPEFTYFCWNDYQFGGMTKSETMELAFKTPVVEGEERRARE